MISLCFTNKPVTVSAKNQGEVDPVVVVSMGDSYSSGEGIEDFYGQKDSYGNERLLEQKTASYDWLAHRSKESWPGQLIFSGMDDNISIKNYKMTSEYDNSIITSDEYVDTSTSLTQIKKYEYKWYFVAASGATTQNIIQSEQNKEYTDRKGTLQSTSLPKQIDIFDEIKDEVDFVTLTIGGNDAEFSNIITTCVTTGKNFRPFALEQQINKVWKSAETIYANLRQTYQAIHSKAPNAKIIVAGYPKLFDPAGGFGVNPEEATLINNTVSKFNDQIEQNVISSSLIDDFIDFVDVETKFEGHGAYSHEAWLNDIILLPQSQDLNKKTIASSYSVHPNKDGAKAYAECVNEYIYNYENNTFAGGDGTETNPYQISTPEQLNAIRNDLDAHYILKNDIDMIGINWDPIGTGYWLNPYNYFNGSLNGNGYKIKNLTIKDKKPFKIHSDDEFNGHYCNSYGLFAYASDAVIENLALENINYDIHTSVPYDPKLGNHPLFASGIGCMLGKSIINNCSVSGNINISGNDDVYCGGLTVCGFVTDSINKTDIIAKNLSGEGSIIECGGISAMAYNISNSINYGNISGTNEGTFAYVGGINGKNGNIKYCINYGDIFGQSKSHTHNNSFAGQCQVGGITGASWDNISDCINYGTIDGNSYSYYSYAGGIIGYSGYYGDGSVHNCYNFGEKIKMISYKDTENHPGEYYSNANRIAGVFAHNDKNNLYSLDTTLVNDSIPTKNITQDDVNGLSLSKNELNKKVQYIFKELNPILN